MVHIYGSESVENSDEFGRFEALVSLSGCECDCLEIVNMPKKGQPNMRGGCIPGTTPGSGLGQALAIESWQASLIQ